MSRPLQLKAINTVSVAVPGGSVTPPFSGTVQDSNNMPTGDLEAYEFYLRLYGTTGYTYTVTPVAQTNGQEIFLKGFTLMTDKHGKIYDNIDGLGLYRLNQFRYRTAGQRLALAAPAASPSTTNFSTDYLLPMACYEYARPYDTMLDLLKSRITLQFQLGSVSGGSLGGTGDLYSGGTATVEQLTALNYQFGARILNGPIVEPGDKSPGGQIMVPETPEWMPSWELSKQDITATQTGRRIALPYGDRIYRRLYLSQRLSTTQAEQTNSYLSDVANVGIEVNSFPFGDKMQNMQMQAINKSNYEIETLPSGWTILDFDETGRYPDMLSVIDRANGICNLVADVTTGANAQVWIYMETLKPIPDQALRASQLALRQAAIAA